MLAVRGARACGRSCAGVAPVAAPGKAGGPTPRPGSTRALERTECMPSSAGPAVVRGIRWVGQKIGAARSGAHSHFVQVRKGPVVAKQELCRIGFDQVCPSESSSRPMGQRSVEAAVRAGPVPVTAALARWRHAHLQPALARPGCRVCAEKTQAAGQVSPCRPPVCGDSPGWPWKGCTELAKARWSLTASTTPKALLRIAATERRLSRGTGGALARGSRLQGPASELGPCRDGRPRSAAPP